MNGIDVTIREAAAEDAGAISRVHMSAIRGLCSTHYDERQIEAWAAGRTPEYYERVLAAHELFVAERDGAVVAFGRIDLESGTVVAVYVTPEAAGSGVGEAMMAHLEGVARMHGWSKLHLTASLNAVPFYEKLGYERVAPFQQQIANDVVLDCVDMRKTLPKDAPRA